MQFRVIVVTDPHTKTHTQTNPQTGLITIHCAAKLSAQCNNNNHHPRHQLLLILVSYKKLGKITNGTNQ